MPVRPGPSPAPLVRYFLALAGIAGRASLVTFQVEEAAGHSEAPEVELYPPSPDGSEVAARAFCKRVN